MRGRVLFLPVGHPAPPPWRGRSGSTGNFELPVEAAAVITKAGPLRVFEPQE